MKLYAYEWKKLIKDPFVLILTVLLLVLTVVSTFLMPADSQRANTQELYDTSLERAIENAKKSLIMSEEREGFHGLYEQESGRQFIACYEKNRGIEISETVNENTALLFDGGLYILFLFFGVIFTVGRIFLSEYEDGAMPLVRSTEKGRTRLLVIKWLAALSAVLALTLLFCGAVLICHIIRFGVPSFTASIQSLGTFTYCPFRVSVGVAYAALLLLRFAVLSLFGSVVALFCLLIKGAVGAYIASIIVFISQVALSRLHLLGANRYPLLVNLYSLACGRGMFDRYHGMQVLSCSVSLSTLVICAIPLLIAILAAVHFILWRRVEKGGGLIHRVNKEKSPKKKHKVKIRRTTVLRSECKRLLVHQYAVLLLLVILGAKYIYFNATAPEIFPMEKMYHRYITPALGEITSQTDAVIKGYEDEIIEIDLEYNDATEKYYKDEMPREDYMKIKSKWSAQEARRATLDRVKGRIADINGQNDAGLAAEVVYETGWETVFSNSFDIFLYFLLLLISVRSFSQDYENGSVVIMRTSGGYARTVCKRTAVILVFGAVCALCAFALDTALIMRTIDCPCYDAPLRSLPSFEGIALNVSIMGGVILMGLQKALCAVAFCTGVCAVSAVTKRTLWALAIGALVLLLIAAFFSIVLQNSFFVTLFGL